MSRNSWEYLIDSLLFICIVGIVFIGILMGLVIPKGPAVAESSKYFLGLHGHEWGNIHFCLSIAFVVLTVVHPILNWSWIKCQAGQIFKKGWTAALILTALVSILVLIIFWSFYARPRATYAGYHYGYDAGRNASFQPEPDYKDNSIINGQMTFHHIENISGIPAADIIKALGLPADISQDEHLGRLSKRYRFSLQDIRQAVSSLLKQKYQRSEEQKTDPGYRY